MIKPLINSEVVNVLSKDLDRTVSPKVDGIVSIR